MILSASCCRSRMGVSLFQVLIVIAILVILAGVTSEICSDNYGYSKKDKAILRAKAIENAANAYYLRYKQFPPNTMALINPGNGEKPFIEGGNDAITTPWGGQFTIGETESDPSELAIVVRWVDGDGQPHNHFEKPKPDQKSFTLFDALVIAAILVMLALVSRAVRVQRRPLQESQDTLGLNGPR
jgi:type II secretory pathway pseudopilin PulG